MLPKLYKEFVNEGFFTPEEAAAIVKNRDTLKTMIKQLINSGYICRIRRGLYETIPLGYSKEKKPLADKFLLARKITRQYCYAYHSALEIHGAANSAIYKIVYVASPKRFRSFNYEGVKYVHALRRDFWGTEKVIWQSLKVIVTDRERTILDCLDRIDYAGGFEEMYKSLVSLTNINLQHLYDYAVKFNVESLFHKLGYFISLPAVKEAWEVDAKILQLFRKKLSRTTYYYLLERKKGNNKLIKEWKLVVPKDIEEAMTFA